MVVKTPKKDKPRRQTPEERQETLRYNHMMYGPTPGERRPAAKKIDFGASYLKHPKFMSLMTAFKHGEKFQFNVTDKGKNYVISTEEGQILFDGKVVYYSRPVNRFESHLLMDRAVLLQHQGIDALVHMVIAVLRGLSELGAPQLSFANGEFFYAGAKLETGIQAEGPNVLVGTYRTTTAKEKKRT